MAGMEGISDSPDEEWDMCRGWISIVDEGGGIG